MDQTNGNPQLLFTKFWFLTAKWGEQMMFLFSQLQMWKVVEESLSCPVLVWSPDFTHKSARIRRKLVPIIRVKIIQFLFRKLCCRGRIKPSDCGSLWASLRVDLGWTIFLLCHFFYDFMGVPFTTPDTSNPKHTKP